MSELFSIIFGLGSATSFGSGDFIGGYVTKKNHVFLVLFISQIAGLLLLALFAIVGQDIFPSLIQIIAGALAGIFGGLGLLAFYKSLSMGKMAISAPVTSVVTPIIPIFLSLFVEPILSEIKILGMVIALVAIWFVTQSSEKKSNLTRNDILPPVLAGIGFGLFMVFINFASEDSLFYPLIFARIASITMMFIILLFSKKINELKSIKLPMILLAGILDTLGNLFFILSASYGRLDIASILTSFGPAITIILALVVLKEKISNLQFFGLILTTLSVILFSI